MITTTPRFGVLFAACLLAGCGTLTNVSGPPPSFSLDTDIAGLEAHYTSATSIAAYYSQPETLERRNEFIVGRLTLINLEYIKFIQQFAIGKAQLDTITDVTELGLNLATTLAGGAATKSVLGAISAGISGTKLSIDKNFLEQKTISALVSQMNADRSKALVLISQGLTEAITAYPLASAIVDLNVYYEAGTLQGALQAIQTDAGAKQATAQKQLDASHTFTDGADDDTARLLAWLFPGETAFSSDGKPLDAAGHVVAKNDANAAALTAWWTAWQTANGANGLSLNVLLRDPTYAAARALAVQKLLITTP